MSDLSELLPQGKKHTFLGKEITVKPLDFNRLALAEEKYGSIANISFAYEDQRWLLWLILQGTEFPVTEDEAGQIATPARWEEIDAFMFDVLEFSGVFTKKTEAEIKAEAEKAEAEEGESGKKGRAKARTSPATSAGSSSAPV